jgi:hypothetical protein
LSNAPEEILALCSLLIELDQAAQCIYHTIFFLNAIDRLLNEATQQTELAKAIDLYKKAQRLALENLWQHVPAMLRVNYIGCHMPTTGGCDTNPMRGDGFIRAGDFWRK